ncbi:hypothetical protein [Azospirillum palustre]|uniref:hypothetical protein n=1 Tax=Azospirillum palustre TaxID=2044885 RepID=UPI0011786F19|nr:hypothetical protein [Azospirillum palustre]
MTMPLQSDASHVTSATSRDNVLAVLDAKHAELDAHRRKLMEQLANTEKEMELLQGTIQLLSKVMVAPSPPHFFSSPLRMLPDFRRGEIRDSALRVLREKSHPLSTQEIGKIICLQKSLDMNKRYFKTFCLRISGSLRNAEKERLVHAVGRTETGAILWFAPAAE